MCLRISKKFKNEKAAEKFVSEPKLTKTNRTVYKVLLRRTRNSGQNFFIAPYQMTQYRLGKLKTVKKFSFSFDSGRYIYNNVTVNINMGLHANTTIHRARIIRGNGIRKSDSEMCNT